MLKKILGTIGSRYLIAFLNLALIFINAKVLGIEGVGMIGLIVASVNIAVIVNGILCGNTIVYFMNRYSMRTIFLPAYLWTPIGSSLACGFMYLTGLLPTGYRLDIFLLAILSSTVNANARFLLGKDNIKGFNLTFILQGGLLFFVLLYFYYILKRLDVRSYVWGLYVTNGIAFIASLSMLVPDFLKETSRSSGKSLCTTRLNYFLIQRFAGLGSVGLLDAGTKISESVWNISRSVSFIEYSSVAKTSEATEQKRITLQLFKLTFCALALVMGCILLVPEWIYTDYLFSAEFKGIRKGGLSIGIVALGCNSIISHYFIGSGKIRYSTASSCVGLIALLISGFLLIPSYGVVGSAITTSIAFTSMLVFSLTVFSRQTLTRWNEFLPDKKDFQACRIHIQKSL